MMLPNRLSSRPLVVVVQEVAVALRNTLLITLLSLTSAAMVAATPSESAPERGSLIEMRSEEQSDSGVSAEQAIVPSPKGCDGWSNNPHRSWDAGNHGVKGVTEINCQGRDVAQLRTTAQVWRNRWWGYEKVGFEGENTNTPRDWGWTPMVKASGTFATCQVNSWRTSGQHWSWEYGETYYLETMKHADIATC